VQDIVSGEESFLVAILSTLTAQLYSSKYKSAGSPEQHSLEHLRICDSSGRIANPHFSRTSPWNKVNSRAAASYRLHRRSPSASTCTADRIVWGRQNSRQPFLLVPKGQLRQPYYADLLSARLTVSCTSKAHAARDLTLYNNFNHCPMPTL
jgi:hypothetical protein